MRAHVPRPGFTIAELVAALGILALAMVLVAQVSVCILGEHSRAGADLAAEELAANVLESARAQPWEALTPTWAAAQSLPAPFAERGWRLTVIVAPETGRRGVKRVTVEVDRSGGETAHPRPVRLVGLFSARLLPGPGGVV